MKLYATILLCALLATFDPSNAQDQTTCPAGQQPKLDLTYLGCYNDNFNDREYSSSFYDKTNIESCAGAARAQNVKYISLTYGQFCQGGATYGRYGLADPSQCDKPCVSKPEQICGGVPEQSVYEIYYQPVNETRPCVGCQPGTYSSNGTKCETAPKGAYVPSSNSSTYINCTRGAYQNQVGQTSCITCDVKKGQLCPTDGMSDPIMVPAGYIASDTLSPITSPCPIGTYRSSNMDATKCEPCPGGMYNDKIAQGTCFKAPYGTFTPGGMSSYTPCPIGFSTEGQYGQSVCTACAPGTATNKTGSRICTPCELSTQYQDVSGQANCKTCPQYTFSYKTTAPCQKCGACKSIYSYLASQALLGNLKITENGADWKLLKDASAVGIDVSYGKEGVLLQLKKCYNVGQFAIEDLKNPNQQCIAAGAPDQVPDVPTPAPGTPPPPPIGSSGVRHTCSFAVIGVIIVTLVSLLA